MERRNGLFIKKGLLENGLISLLALKKPKYEGTCSVTVQSTKFEEKFQADLFQAKILGPTFLQLQKEQRGPTYL